MVKTALTLIVGLLLSFAAAAQQMQSDTAKLKTPRPLWSELSPKQQAVLAPLAAEWDRLDTTRRKKWVTIANRFPKMKPDEQVRLQRRMQAWAALTPDQRRVARDNYKALRQLPRPQPGELRQKWEQQKQSPTPEAAASDAPGK